MVQELSPDKTANHLHDVDSKVRKLNPSVNGCTDLSFLEWLNGYLPVTVVAELELNSVIPPPDKIEEEKQI